jgi:hypothetical protein
MAYATVKPADLIAHCMRYLNEGWGYIYGASGQIWTQAKQDASTDEQVKKYGQQWVGKHVIDCSGVWYLAMKELGSYMYHGSNSMWSKYTVNKGRLSKGARTDGQELKPGSAIFTGIADGDHNHVGIYIGDGKVLEAGGVQKGVITTAVTLAKWTCWGEMKYVDYGDPTPAPAPAPGTDKPTLRRGASGEYVTLAQTKLIQRGYDLAPYGADGKFGAKTETAVKAFQKDRGLTIDGIIGRMTWAALEDGKTTLYTVLIQHVSKSVAEDIIGKFGGTMTAEGSDA